MANYNTQIADVIVPEVFSPYVIEKIQEQSALFQSGIATVNPVLNQLITGGGKTISIPAFKDLVGRSQVLSDTTAMTTNKISSKEDIACVLYRGNAWSANELAGALSGTDPAEVIAGLVADYWVREEQAILIDILNGVFGATSMSGLVQDASTGVYDGDLIIDAQGKLGDAAGKLTGIVMHSAVRNDLLKKDKSAFETYRDGKVQYDKYLGYDVIVDDTCPVANGVYTSYLFAKGAVSLGTGTPSALTLTETDRDSLASNDILINRRAFVVHPNGLKWVGTSLGATPSDTELKTGANWERASEVKNIGIVQVKAKIGTVSTPEVDTPAGGTGTGEGTGTGT